MKTHFSNVEKIDGYFSGTLEINANNGDNFIFDFGYDIDTSKMNYWNCRVLVNHSGVLKYAPYSVADLLDRFGDTIHDEIYETMVFRYGPQKSFAEYEAEAYREEYEF